MVMSVRSFNDAVSPVTPSLTRRAALTRLGAGAIGLTLAARRLGVLAQEATPAAMGEIPPIIQAWVDAWNSGDPETLLALFTADAMWEEVPFGEASTGTDELRAAFTNEFTTFNPITVMPKVAFQTETMAAAEVVFSGTYATTAEGLPPAAGQTFDVPTAVIFELDGDLIRRESDYFDAYSLLIQLGALEEPGGESEATPAS